MTTDHLDDAEREMGRINDDLAPRLYIRKAIAHLIADRREHLRSSPPPVEKASGTGELPDTLKAFRDWAHDESGISTTYQLTRNQAQQLLSWAGVARKGRTLQRAPLVLDDDDDVRGDAPRAQPSGDSWWFRESGRGTRVTPSSIVHAACGSPPMPDCVEHSGRCWLCAGAMARGEPVSSWSGSSFTGQNRVRSPDSTHVCEACVFVCSRLSPVPGRLPGPCSACSRPRAKNK